MIVSRGPGHFASSLSLALGLTADIAVDLRFEEPVIVFAEGAFEGAAAGRGGVVVDL